MYKANIVIAEDEPEILFGLAFILRSSDYNVIEAADGLAALKALVEMQAIGTPCDLLVCDIQLPKMNGEELIKALHKKEIAVPILAISGYASKEQVVELMRLGCRDFIDKPFMPEIFESRVEELLEAASREREQRISESDFKRMEARTKQCVHDINNLLGVALGYTDVVMDRLTESERLQSDLNIVLHSTSEAASICHHLMTLNRSDTKSPLRPIVVNLCINRIANLLEYIAPENVQLKIEPCPFQLWVNGDVERIQQVLLNLALNAIDAMPNGGVLMISLELGCGTKDSDLDENEEGNTSKVDNAKIVISDTGEGIPAENLCRVFEKGFTTKLNGNGIGLATVLEIVQEHGGEIYLDSVPGGGTRFELMFPITIGCSSKAIPLV